MAVVLAVGCLALAGCGSDRSEPRGAARGRLSLVAAENIWGSLAGQLGGDRARVHSIVVNPDTDPHAYQPKPSDAIAVAQSQMAIVNGIGYDDWASRLLAANADGSRVVLNVGGVLGRHLGDNPHQWYSPTAVGLVLDRMVADLKRLDPTDAGYFDRRLAFVTNDLAAGQRLRSEIRRRYAGVPVGYSESIFEPLGQALNLRLETPAGFARALAEGSDVSAADKQAVDTQAQTHRIKVWIVNAQNLTPDVQRVTEIARAAGVPVVNVTETLAPASASFEQWQDAQLARLLAALHAGTGR